MIGRIFRVIRTPVTLIILLAALVYAAYWGYTNVIAPVPPPPPTPCVEQSLPKRQLSTKQVYVKVFNGGDSRGLAANVSRSLRSKGFKVTGTSNTIEKIDQTVIVGSGEGDPEVQLAKRFFKGATVRADGRADHSVDVLVGNRYGGFNKSAKTTITVDADTLCLPAPESASASPTPA
ncbi:LytR C-terminal domain-containing protein [Microlunatus flavus]|uniref:LytR cell envelope-related transcriptional attenuator n=1 Tax=Microlunatus flavus TaxID=1036181 RepID=A0A1H8ZWY4_9ACTN|nr:LytR C-terminal domain-containing protein [Microlunatus flavus]SEP68278.1 LytR cell envelope-related transcriptional attenuator [Microlunatus flavus]